MDRTIKLPAMTIAESIAAMIIITLSFGAGIIIHNSVFSNDKAIPKAQANIIVEDILEKTYAYSDFRDESFKKFSFYIERRLTPYKHSIHFTKNVYVLSVQVLNQQKKVIIERKSLVHIP